MSSPSERFAIGVLRIVEKIGSVTLVAPAVRTRDKERPDFDLIEGYRKLAGDGERLLMLFAWTCWTGVSDGPSLTRVLGSIDGDNRRALVSLFIETYAEWYGEPDVPRTPPPGYEWGKVLVREVE